MKSKSEVDHEPIETYSNVTCCQLKEVANTKNGRNEVDDKTLENTTLEDLREECKRNKILDVARDERVTFFNPVHRNAIMKLAELLSARTDFNDLLSVAAAVRIFVNLEVFKKAILRVILTRKDMDLQVPLTSDIFPADIPESSKSEQSFPEIVINWNVPPYKTYPDSEPESRMWYFREDPQLNSHHDYWHILFSDSRMDRRGEFFYYMHKQMLLRYKVDRIANGIQPIVSLSPENWNQPVQPGYNPRIRPEIGRAFGPRRDNSNLRAFEMRQLNNFYREILQVIRSRQYVDRQRGTRRLLSTADTDSGIDILGDIVEQTNSPNRELYGSLHNSGHVQIAMLSDGEPGVMTGLSVAMRDPLFYQWHEFIEDLFNTYKQTLSAYSENQLGFPGVSIETSEIVSNDEWNTLFTYSDATEVVANVVADGVPVRMRYNRLNHRPFFYRIKVQNENQRIHAKARIFLVPKNQPSNTNDWAIEMDRFLVTLENGDNTIIRNSNQSTITGERQQSLTELQDSLHNEFMFNRRPSASSGCGWPTHMLVPKGTSSGHEFTLFVMLSKLLPNDAAISANAGVFTNSAFGFCGLAGGGRVPDSRPMGFPFDRPFSWESFQLSNIALTDISIYHNE